MEAFTDASCLGVIFDCDGTLLDSMNVWRELEESLGKRAGVTLTKRDTDILTTLTIPECGAYFHEQFGLGSSCEEVVSMIHEFMLVYYSQRCCEREGALAFVRALAAYGVHMCVASSSPQVFLQAGMKHAGFAPYIDAILSVDDVGASKREPAIYQKAQEIMGTQTHLTWGFEDSTYAVETLRNAGFKAVGVYDCDKSGTFESLSKSATIAIRSFTELSAEEFIAQALKRDV